MATAIYDVFETEEDDGVRPYMVTYYPPEKFGTEEGWQIVSANANVQAGNEGYPIDRWVVPDLFASIPGATPIKDWDFYYGESFGIYSPRALEVLSPYFGNRFVPLPARLEGNDYYCLRCESRIDCLDKERSKIKYYDFSPNEIMMVDKYVFHKDIPTDPMFFAVPDLIAELFCTESIPGIVANAGLRGMHFELLDSV